MKRVFEIIRWESCGQRKVEQLILEKVSGKDAFACTTGKTLNKLLKLKYKETKQEKFQLKLGESATPTTLKGRGF